MKIITALFVETNGIYFNDARIDPWDITRDAFKFRGPGPIIAHPPCQRWGRYWGGGPSVNEKRILGDDGGAFAHSLWAVRTFGGVIEHPEASHAWKWFGLTKPPRFGGWAIADNYGGVTCCVEQGHYGHLARKATWLYGVNIKMPELKWGPCEKKARLDQGFHSAEERRRAIKTGICQRLSKKQRAATPKQFKECLIDLVTN